MGAGTHLTHAQQPGRWPGCSDHPHQPLTWRTRTDKARTATDTQRLYKSVLAQITFRVLHELWTADPHGHVQRIAFNGVVDDIDPSTGRPTRPKLVSLRIDRETFLERDLSHPQLDPQRALKGLKANFSSAPTELEPVPPILEFDVDDPRFIDEEEILSGLDDRTNLIDLTPHHFETVIRDLFQAMGFDTYQTRPSRDGGVDCVAHCVAPGRRTD
jgi:restriction system protein